MAVCMLFNAINSFQNRLLVANKILLVVCLLWVVSGSTLAAFQCPVPIDWYTFATNKDCSRRIPITAFNMTVDLLTEVALSTLPVVLIWNVQTTHLKKLQIISLFGSRFL